MKRLFALAVIATFFITFCGAGYVFAEEANAVQPSESTKLVIEEPGTYILSGKLPGGVSVDTEGGNVILVLDNAEIECANGPALSAVGADLLQIEVKENTCNKIADKKENAKQAAIYTESDTVIHGTGCLQIEGNSRFGILAKDADVTFEGATSLILAEEYAFQMEGDQPGSIFVRAGSVYVNAKKGIAAEGTDIRISGGSLEESDHTCIKEICGCADCLRPCQTIEPVKEKESCCTPTTDKPGEVVHGENSNGAAVLEPDLENAVKIEMNADNNRLEISVAGTYIVSGKCDDGSVTITKGTKGVVLILDNLELTNQDGSAVTAEEDSEVKIIVEKQAVLSDGGNPDETPVENNYSDKGKAAIKGEKNAQISIAGSGTLKVKGNVQHGIQTGEGSTLVIDDKKVTVQINAKEDGIMAANDVAINDGTVSIEAGNDGIHAEHILEIGKDNAAGPNLSVEGGYDGLEANVININSGAVTIDVAQDGFDTGAKGTGGDLKPSVNFNGGTTHVISEDEGIDSDGNVNMIKGSLVIEKKNNSGEDCMAVDEDLYIAEDFDFQCGCDNDDCEYAADPEDGRG